MFTIRVNLYQDKSRRSWGRSSPNSLQRGQRSDYYFKTTPLEGGDDIVRNYSFCKRIFSNSSVRYSATPGFSNISQSVNCNNLNPSFSNPNFCLQFVQTYIRTSQNYLGEWSSPIPLQRGQCSDFYLKLPPWRGAGGDNFSLSLLFLLENFFKFFSEVFCYSRKIL